MLISQYTQKPKKLGLEPGGLNDRGKNLFPSLSAVHSKKYAIHIVNVFSGHYLIKYLIY